MIIFEEYFNKVLLIKDSEKFIVPEHQENINKLTDGNFEILKRKFGSNLLENTYIAGSNFNDEKGLSIFLASVVAEEEIKNSNQVMWVEIENLNYHIGNNSLTNEIKTIKHIAEKETNLSKFTDLLFAINSTIKAIKDSTNVVNKQVGWDHNLDIKGRLGIIGTSIGILALTQRDAASSIDILLNASKTLISKQHPVGGWGTTSLQEGGFPVAHSTAFAIWALSTVNIKEQQDQIKQGINWLEKIQKGGGWGIDKSAEITMTTPTTLALMALCKTGVNKKAQDDAIQWLIRAKHSREGWGAFSFTDKPNQKPTPSHTGRAIYALTEAGVSPTEKIITESAQWIMNNCSLTGTWEDTAESEYINKNTGRLEFKHAGLQWALIGLLSAKIPITNFYVNRGIKHLLNRQHSSGAWENALAPGHFPIWAALDSMIALNLAYEHSITGVVSERKVNNNPALERLLGNLDKYKKNIITISTRNTSKFGNKEGTETSSAFLKSGMLFLLILVALIVTTAITSTYVNALTLSIILTFVLLASVIIIISVLRHTDHISAENLSELMKATLNSIGLLRGKPSKQNNIKENNDN